MNKMLYLLWCANEHLDFRIPEIKSLASVYKIDLKWIEEPTEDPYIVIDLDGEHDARRLIERSMLVRSCYELWGCGITENELHESVRSRFELIKPHLKKENTFKISVTGFNKTLTRLEKLNKIESYSYLPFEGKVKLQNPDVSLHLIEFYGLSPNNVPEAPLRRFFGRWLADGNRELIHSYTLKSRTFIGSTSMDPQLAFLMTNLAQVGPGSIVIDPFVGTGSILVSAAQRGAYVWGWDIDFLTLHGRRKPTRYKQTSRKPSESILSNLRQYGVENRYLDVAVMDSSNLAWRKCGLIDAIITDPPYGIRESTERVGVIKERKAVSNPTSKKELQYNVGGMDSESISGDVKVSTEADNRIHDTDSRNGTLKKIISTSSCQMNRSGTKASTSEFERSTSSLVHYPSKMAYNLADIFGDLLNFSALHLSIGGRLVFWVPVFREDYTDDVLPNHPCLRLEFNCEQVLNTHSSRRLITLIKIREPEIGDGAVANLLAKSEEFRIRFFKASQLLTKDERQKRKQIFPRDKRGQGLGYRLRESSDLHKEENCLLPTKTLNGYDAECDQLPKTSRVNVMIRGETGVSREVSLDPECGHKKVELISSNCSSGSHTSSNVSVSELRDSVT